MCQRNGVVVKKQGSRVTIYPVRCKSWSCPDCKQYRARLLRAQAYEGKPNRFVTLTVNPHNFETPEERCRQMTLAWRDFVREWRRTHGGARIEYMYVIEATKRGEPHMHILVRSDYIPQDELSAWMGERTGAPVVTIERPRTVRGVAKYVTKYVTKDLHQFEGSKRYFRSRGWLKQTIKERKAIANAGAIYWLLEGRYSTFINELDRRGVDWIAASSDKFVYRLKSVEDVPYACLAEPPLAVCAGVPPPECLDAA